MKGRSIACFVVAALFFAAAVALIVMAFAASGPHVVTKNGNYGSYQMFSYSYSYSSSDSTRALFMLILGCSLLVSSFVLLTLSFFMRSALTAVFEEVSTEEKEEQEPELLQNNE